MCKRQFLAFNHLWDKRLRQFVSGAQGVALRA
jgi:hypothetical protein